MFGRVGLGLATCKALFSLFSNETIKLAVTLSHSPVSLALSLNLQEESRFECEISRLQQAAAADMQRIRQEAAETGEREARMLRCGCVWCCASWCECAKAFVTL